MQSHAVYERRLATHTLRSRRTPLDVGIYNTIDDDFLAYDISSAASRNDFISKQQRPNINIRMR